MADTEVVVEDGLITAVRPARGPVPALVLAPGFVDLQVNGIGAIDVAGAAGPDWDDLDRALLAQGVTTWCPTIVTAPLDGLERSLAGIAEAARRPGGGRPAIAGAHLEGPFVAVPGAHRPEFVRGRVDLAWLDSLGDAVRILTIAPELPGAIDAIAALRGRGVLVSLGHSACTAETAVEAAEAGARLVTHLGNAMGPLHQRAPGSSEPPSPMTVCRCRSSPTSSTHIRCSCAWRSPPRDRKEIEPPALPSSPTPWPRQREARSTGPRRRDWPTGR